MSDFPLGFISFHAHLLLVFEQLIILLLSKFHQLERGDRTSAIIVRIDLAPHISLECFIRYQFVGFGEMGEEILGCFAICSQLLNIAVELSVECVDVILMFHDEDVSFRNLEAQCCRCSIGFHKVNVDPGHDQTWSIWYVVDIKVCTLSHQVFRDFIRDGFSNPLVNLMTDLCIPDWRSNVISGGIVSDMIECNLAILRDEIAFHVITSCMILPNSDGEDVVPSGTLRAIA